MHTRRITAWHLGSVHLSIRCLEQNGPLVIHFTFQWIGGNEGAGLGDLRWNPLYAWEGTRSGVGRVDYPPAGQCASGLPQCHYSQCQTVRRVGRLPAQATMPCHLYWLSSHTSPALRIPLWWRWHLLGCQSKGMLRYMYSVDNYTSPSTTSLIRCNLNVSSIYLVY